MSAYKDKTPRERFVVKIYNDWCLNLVCGPREKEDIKK